MSDERAATVEDSPPLWRYCPLDEYQAPAGPLEHRARTRLAGLWNQLLSAAEEPKANLKTAEEVQVPSEALLRQVAPVPDWRGAAAALQGCLKTWLEQEQADHLPVCVVGAPYSGNADIVTSWARMHRWRVIDPPTSEQILAADAHWLAQWDNDDTPWVLPRLEKCYLRHARGLTLLRQLFDRLGTGRLRRGVIGCESWAWAYIQHVWQGASLMQVMAQAFDAEHLACWLQGLAAASGTPRVVFRHLEDGTYVMPPTPEGAETPEPALQTSNFLRCLAAESRGIPGVSWALWRHNLLLGETDKSEAENRQTLVQHSRQTTIWVRPWKQIKQLALPFGTNRDHTFVLHALLLHSALSAELLPYVLPLATHDVGQILCHLQASGFLQASAEGWRVSPLGYPAVRRLLLDADFLTDASILA